MHDYIDLHLHSTFSDGVLTPTELVAEAAQAGLRAIALADHDNLDGIDEALAAGRRHGIEVITGVELSVVWGDIEELHLLGYDFDHADTALRQALVESREFRTGRSQAILDKINLALRQRGLAPLDYAEVARRAGGTLGRPHIGQALIAAGYVRDMEQAFTDYLVPNNVPKRDLSIDTAIAMLHAAGGCTVLAHPPFIRIPDAALLDLLGTFKGMGLDGLEAYNSGTDNHGIDRYITLARRLGLIVTGGSDFHQPAKGGVTIGRGRGNLKIPYQCVQEIRTASMRYKG